MNISETSNMYYFSRILSPLLLKENVEKCDKINTSKSIKPVTPVCELHAWPVSVSSDFHNLQLLLRLRGLNCLENRRRKHWKLFASRQSFIAQN